MQGSSLELYLFRVFINVIVLFIVLQSSLIQNKPPLLEFKVSCVRMMHPSLALKQLTHLVDLRSGIYMLLPCYLRLRTSHFACNTSKHWKLWHSTCTNLCYLLHFSTYSQFYHHPFSWRCSWYWWTQAHGCSNYYNYS